MSESSDDEIYFIRKQSQYEVKYHITADAFSCRFLYETEDSEVSDYWWAGDHNKLINCDEFKEARRKYKLRKFNAK